MNAYTKSLGHTTIGSTCMAGSLVRSRLDFALVCESLTGLFLREGKSQRTQ